MGRHVAASRPEKSCPGHDARLPRPLCLQAKANICGRTTMQIKGVLQPQKVLALGGPSTTPLEGSASRRENASFCFSLFCWPVACGSFVCPSQTVSCMSSHPLSHVFIHLCTDLTKFTLVNSHQSISRASTLSTSILPLQNSSSL